MPEQLPGQDLIQEGLRDLGKTDSPAVTLAALLVSIGAPRLRSLGVTVPRTISRPEYALYRFLSEAHPGRPVHSLYNAYIRRLTRFERALSCANRPARNESAD